MNATAWRCVALVVATIATNSGALGSLDSSLAHSRLVTARSLPRLSQLRRQAPVSLLRAVGGDGAGSEQPDAAAGTELTAIAPTSDQRALTPPPRFSWRMVFFFAANPLALLPIAGLGALLKVGIFGPALGLTVPAVALGAALAVPLLVLTNLPLERIPGLSALEEVNTVSQFLTYLLFGEQRGVGSAARVLVASVIVSAAAGIAEELAFRGAFQGGLASLCALAGASPTVCAGVAISVSSIVFGLLHSYSSSPAYALAAGVVSAYFGAIYLQTQNIVVPIVTHFVTDLFAFVSSHISVAYRKTAAEREELWKCEQPIALSLKMVAGYAPARAKDEPVGRAP